MNKKRLITQVVLLFILDSSVLGCGKYENNNALTISSNEVVAEITTLENSSVEIDTTNAEAENLFINNRKSLSILVNFCISHPSVKWLSKSDIDESKKINSNLDKDKIKFAREILDDVGILSLSCSRDWSKDDIPLKLVTFTLEAKGLSVSGSSMGIKYFFSSNKYLDEIIDSGEFSSLGEAGWYIYKNQ